MLESENEGVIPERGKTGSIEDEAIPKWHLIGIGGCGCNIVDDVLVRRELLKADQMYSEIFEKGIASWWVLNTNIADLRTMDTLKDMGLADPELAERYIIAQSRHNWTGAGGNPEKARKWMEYDCSGASVSEDSIPAKSSKGDSKPSVYKSRLDYILNNLGAGEWKRPQAVLMIHGVGKGTGCGATPPLVEGIKEMAPVLPVFSVSILPFREELESSGSVAYDTIYGLTRAIKSADVTMLVANTQLESSVPVPPQYATIQDSANNEPQQFAANKFFRKFINPPILTFLETLTVPSIGAFHGLAIDISDIIEFVRNGSIYSDLGVIVPLYYETLQIDTPLDTLIENAIGFAGRLIDCKPETAVGAYVILVGDLPRFKHFRDLMRTPKQFYNRVQDIAELQASQKGYELDDVRIAFATTNEKDRIRILILLVNPQIPSFAEIYNRAKKWVDRERGGKPLREEHRDVFAKILPTFKKVCENTQTSLK